MSQIGRKGGKAGKGAAKRRTTEQARAAGIKGALARWGNGRAAESGREAERYING